MPIQLSAEGFLPPGEVTLDIGAFSALFGNASKIRAEAVEVLPALLKGAEELGAVDVFIAGSFVTSKKDPNDLDLLVVHKTKETIPQGIESFDTARTRIDLQYASYDEPEILASFLDFLTTRRNGQKVGIVRIGLVTEEGRPALPASSPLVVKAIQLSYGMHHVTENKRILITVHGILTNAKWNAEVTRLASDQGWVVAPYDYGFTAPFVLLSKTLRRKEVARFQHWLDRIHQEHPYPISIIAHSFGTYIVGRYLTGWGRDPPPIPIEALILIGSILDPEIVWSERNHGVRRILNEVAPNDPWVKLMPLVSWSRRGDPLGRAGTKGFKHKVRILTQKKIDNYDHNNPLDSVVIRGRWLPFLNFTTSGRKSSGP